MRIRFRAVVTIAILVVIAHPMPRLSQARFTDSSPAAASFGAATMTQPTGLTVTATVVRAVALSWNPTTDSYAEGYRLYRSTTSGSGYAIVLTLSSLALTTAIDTPLAGGTYYYVAVAYVGGWTSPFSNQVSVTLL